MIRGLDHVNIRTANLAATRAFFVEVLGFTEGWRPDIALPGAWLYANGRALLHLIEVSEPPLPSRSAALDHFALSIADYETVRRRLEAHGVPYRASVLADGAVRQLVVTEPSGVTVELNWKAPGPAKTEGARE